MTAQPLPCDGLAPSLPGQACLASQDVHFPGGARAAQPGAASAFRSAHRGPGPSPRATLDGLRRLPKWRQPQWRKPYGSPGAGSRPEVQVADGPLHPSAIPATSRPAQPGAPSSPYRLPAPCFPTGGRRAGVALPGFSGGRVQPGGGGAGRRRRGLGRLMSWRRASESEGPAAIRAGACRRYVRGHKRLGGHHVTVGLPRSSSASARRGLVGPWRDG